MICMNLRLTPPSHRTTEVANALRLQMGPTQVVPGCIQCRLSQDMRDPNTLLYQEEWSSWRDLEKYISADRFSRILELMELSSTEPELTFNVVKETRGLDYVMKLRKATRAREIHQ